MENTFAVKPQDSAVFKKISPAILGCFEILKQHNLNCGEAQLVCVYLSQKINALTKEKSLSDN